MNDMKNHASAGKTADKHVHKFTTRNTDTITNTHIRKLTSIALMAIMVGGGLTFAIPGMEPAYAQVTSNPNLTVSADGLGGNVITDINIIEVIVRDTDISDRGDSPPIVEIGDGNDPLTMRYYSGSWYGYFASDKIDESGLIDDILVDANPRLAIDLLVRGEPTTLVPTPFTEGSIITTETIDGYLVDLYPLDGEFDVAYQKAPSSQVVQLELDNPDVSVSLDRANYPQNTGVAITIDEMAMNVDPTSEDTWFLIDGSSTARYADANNAGNVAKIATADATKQSKLDAAEAKRTSDVNSAESDETDLIQRADAARQAFVDEAREVRDNLITAAQAIIDNPLLDDTATTHEGLGGVSAGDIIGTGAAVEFDDDDTTNVGVPDASFDDYQDAVGTAQTTYEGVAGRGDRTSNTAEDPNYEGTAQALYEGVAGRGDRTNTDSADPNYEGTAKNTREGIGGPGGSANIAYEWVVGRADADGNPGTDLTQTTALVTRPTEGHAGTAQIEHLNEIEDDDPTTELPGGVIAVPQIAIAGVLETFNINDARSLLKCSTNDCTIIDTKTWMKFTEVDKNDSEFDNTSDDVPSLQTKSGASRGLNFSIEYDSTETASIGYSTTTITIDAGGEWNSGTAATVTLTDSDANTNSLTEDDLEVTNDDQIIPTIRVGTPFTLAEAESSADYTVTPISDILVFNNDKTYGSGDTLTIELGQWSDINDYLPQHEPSFVGTHMLNYDVSALTNANAISLKIGTTPFDLVTATDSEGRDTEILTDASFNATTDDFGALYDADGNVKDFDGATASLEITFDRSTDVLAGASIVVDLFSFGLEDGTDSVNNAIYRLELEEANSNSSDFMGTLEYIALTQMNVWERSTYDGITAIDVDVVLISDDDSVSVEYRDLDSTGGYTTFTAQADTPTHTGTISLDSDAYKASDTVTVTVQDADLNADSGAPDIYTVNLADDKIGSAVDDLFTVSFDDNNWGAGCDGMTGLYGSQFTLGETGSSTGIFEGQFSIPAEYCAPGNNPTSVSGTDVTVDYVDFRDDSGSIISVSASAGIRSSTGSVSLDRTVLPGTVRRQR